MWTKIQIIALAVLCALSLFAQQNNTQSRKRKKYKQTQQTATRSKIQETQSPYEPSLKKHDVDYVLKRYREMIVENRWPQNIQGVYAAAKQRKKNYRRVGDIESGIFLNKLRKFVINPDLEEVMGIRKRWFVSIGKLAAQFDRVTKKVSVALDERNDARYKAAISAVPDIAWQLEKILNNPEKIPDKEWAEIRLANHNRRLKEYYKKMQQKQTKEKME